MHKQTIIDFKELGLRHLFTKPIKELKTRYLDQVEALLREVEAYQEQGFYAVGYVSYEAAPAFEKKFAVHPAPLMGEYLSILLSTRRSKPFLFQRTMKLWIFQPIGRKR